MSPLKEHVYTLNGNGKNRFFFNNLLFGEILKTMKTKL